MFVGFFIFAGLMFVVPAVAQQTRTIIPPSPDAASLGIYGNIPVSTYTGIPNINLPLAQISYRDVSIPLALNYHASGVVVEQDAGWVGLGWSLNAGGVITRTVRGGDDLQTINDGISSVGQAYFDYRGYPYDNQSQTSGTFAADLCEKGIDPEPDIFYFNFMGESGSFILENGQSTSSNYIIGTTLNVTKIDIRYDKVNLRWQLKNSNGFTYYFGTKEISETLYGIGSYGEGPTKIMFNSSNNGFLSYEQLAVTGWYLDKVITPSGEEITYVYDVVAGGSFGIPAGMTASRFGSAHVQTSDIKRTELEGINAPACYIPSAQTSASKTINNHIYLKEINHGLGKVIFNKSARQDIMPAHIDGAPYPYLSQRPFFLSWLINAQGPQKLDNIVLQDKSGNILKRFELEYDYFNPSYTSYDRFSYQRLKLNRVKECAGTSCNPAHQFLYDETQSLPSKYSHAIDFWGYSNGATNNQSKIPHGTGIFNNKTYFLGDSDRQPNLTFATSGILKTIIYPTGGSTEFDFEPHEYSAFGEDAFTLTDFEQTQIVPITSLMTAEYDPNAYQTVEFTLTTSRELVVSSAMTYYLSATTSSPCSVTDPGLTYTGTEPWYSIRKKVPDEMKVTHAMSDFLNFFQKNFNDNCASAPVTPDNIDPIFRPKHNITLDAGTYELKVYRRQGFTISVVVGGVQVSSRTVTQNSNGIFAKLAGGIRVKRITSKADVTSAPTIKKYDYTRTTTGQKYSTGKLMLYPSYHIVQYCEAEPSTSILVGFVGRSWSHLPLATSASGSIVGYDLVTELEGENGENGKTEYEYRNQQEQSLEGIPHLEGLPTKKFKDNGLLKERRVFNSAGDLLQASLYDYDIQLPKEIVGVAYKVLNSPRRDYNGVQFEQNCANQKATVFQEYFLKSDRWVTTETTDRTYSAGIGTPLETITTLSYDAATHLQVNSKTVSLGNGDAIEYQYLYPPQASWIPSTVWQDKHIYDAVVETKTLRQQELVSTSRTHLNSTGQPTQESSSIGNSPLEVESIFEYDFKNNVKSVVQRTKSQEIYLWGYNNIYPVAQIVNATFPEVLAALSLTQAQLDTEASAVTPTTNYLSKLSALRAALPNARIITYQYFPHVGVKSVTDANGLSKEFEYDSFGRLAIVKDNDGNIVKSFAYGFKQ
jgi:YD repeat-containing protein